MAIPSGSVSNLFASLVVARGFGASNPAQIRNPNVETRKKLEIRDGTMLTASGTDFGSAPLRTARLGRGPQTKTLPPGDFLSDFELRNSSRHAVAPSHAP